MKSFKLLLFLGIGLILAGSIAAAELYECDSAWGKANILAHIDMIEDYGGSCSGVDITPYYKFKSAVHLSLKDGCGGNVVYPDTTHCDYALDKTSCYSDVQAEYQADLATEEKYCASLTDQERISMIEQTDGEYLGIVLYCSPQCEGQDTSAISSLSEESKAIFFIRAILKYLSFKDFPDEVKEKIDNLEIGGLDRESKVVHGSSDSPILLIGLVLVVAYILINKKTRRKR